MKIIEPGLREEVARIRPPEPPEVEASPPPAAEQPSTPALVGLAALEDYLPDTPLAGPTPLELEAVRRFSLTGSLAAVGREMGLPLYTLQKMSCLSWWQEDYALLRRQEAAMTNARLTRLFDSTLEQIEDRLAKGDHVLGKGGKTHRVAVTSANLARLATVIFTARQLLRGEPTAVVGDNEKLSRLAEKLRALGQARTFEAELIPNKEP